VHSQVPSRYEVFKLNSHEFPCAVSNSFHQMPMYEVQEFEGGTIKATYQVCANHVINFRSDAAYRAALHDIAMLLYDRKSKQTKYVLL
jgi:hypothetical protein